MSDALKLSIKISNKKPIELNELTNSLNCLAREYDTYCNNELNLPKSDRNLEIVKLEQGSLLIELAPAVVPLIQEINSVYCFGKYFIETIDFFTGKKDAKLNDKFSKKNCDNVSGFFNQSANDAGSNIHIKIEGDNNRIFLDRQIDSVESNAIQNQLYKHRNNLLEQEPQILHKVQFYWSVASFNLKNVDKNSDKGIIEKIDKKQRKVFFQNNEDKEIMTKFNSSLNKDWQNLVYIVDVEALKLQDVIKIYKILKVHTEDTFDPSE